MANFLEEFGGKFCQKTIGKNDRFGIALIWQTFLMKKDGNFAIFGLNEKIMSISLQYAITI